MYQLVIADDEKRIREGLAKVIDWERLGFRVIQLFSDGQEVIDCLDYMEPDVILTDIKMSVVSGLEVAKYVFDHQLSCKVVLISGYQEFELALEGLRYGAEDYLLKPTQVEKVEEVFTRIKKQFDEKKNKRHLELERRRRMEAGLYLLEERFWSDVIMGMVDSDEYIRNCVNILYPGINPDNCECFLIDMVIQDYEHYFGEVWEDGLDAFEMCLKEYLRIRKRDYLFQMVYKSENLIELVGMKHGSENGKRETAVETLLHELKEAFDLNVSFLISDSCSSLFDIRRKNEERLCSRDNGVALAQNLKEQKMLLLSNVSIGNIAMAQKLFHSILQELTGLSRIERANVIIDIMSTMNSILWNINATLAEHLQATTDYQSVVFMKTIDEIRQWADRIFDRLKTENMSIDGLSSSLVERAKKYIRDNISRDISQEETAKHLYISSSYLSRLFHKQTGETYMQYATRIKMEKAMDLLKDPQYKTYQVGEMLGYKTSRYFSKLFRAHTGINPGEYRKRVLQLGGEYEKSEE